MVHTRSTLLILALGAMACGGGETLGATTADEPADEMATAGAETTAPERPPYEEVVAALDGIETDLRPAWESEARQVLLDAYDVDDSGELDTDDEVDEVPCEVWRAINEGYQDRAREDDSVREDYGFAPNTLYVDALGIDRSQRERLRVQLLDCGVR